MIDLELAGALKALEKEAAMPPAMLKGLTALGLLSGGYDMYAGIRDESPLNVAWGMAQLPMTLAGGGRNALGTVGRMFSRLPLMSSAIHMTNKGFGRFGRSIAGKFPVINAQMNFKDKVGLGVGLPLMGIQAYNYRKPIYNFFASTPRELLQEGTSEAGQPIGSVAPEQEVKNIAPKMQLGATQAPMLPQDPNVQFQGN